jgi:F-type H+-transporting ATPase subunit b
MHIDWLTVCAQALNFLVLMWLLKRFLYKPILNAIAARETHIARQLADAAEVEATAHKEQAEFKTKNDAFDKERAALISQAKSEADTLRTTLLKEANEEADALRLQRKKALQAELHDLNSDIVKQTKQQVFAVSAKLLVELADAALEERMVAVFIEQLKALSNKKKSALTAENAIITSAFPLSPEQQEILKFEIKSESLKFKITPDLISGIEISSGGQKLAWSIKDYLETLEQEASHAA